jgi:signal transduction histidine kinase
MARLPRSAAYRIAFVYSAAFAFAVLLSGIVLFLAIHVAFTRELDATVKDEASVLTAEYRSDGEGELADAIAQREASSSRDRLLYAVFGADGRRIHGSLDTGFPPLGLHDLTFIDPREGPDRARGIAVDLAGGRRLLVAADRERIEQVDRTIVSIFASAFLLVLLLGAGGALLLGSYLRRRLGAISDAAEAIVRIDMRRRMPVGARGDEFDRLARSLNLMLDRIDGLIENVRQVSGDIAHDLRTPLARLRNQLEKGLANGLDSQARRDVLDDAIRRVDEVLALFSAILRISEVESGRIRRTFAPVDLSALVADVCESYSPALLDAGRILTCSIQPGLEISGDRELIAQAVINLLENAQGHTPVGTAIGVSLSAAPDTIRLAVADDGPGIPDEDKERIIQRFVRLDPSRSAPGHGLGLNLVAAVARLHEARLGFEDNKPGLRAVLEFALVPR